MTTQLPNVFVVGAPKCGTTSIYYYLKAHPEVFMTEQKELHFFSYPEVADTYYESAFIKDKETYTSLFRDAQRYSVAGDTSPSYLYHKEAAYRIKAHNPLSKIIIILRDPIDRAISHYKHDLKFGYQSNSLLSLLSSNWQGKELYHREYIGNGMYASQLRNYFEVFPKNQILIIPYPELKNDTEGVIAKIYRFVGVDDSFLPSLDIHNSSTVPRINYYPLFGKFPFLKKMRKILPKGLKGSVKAAMGSKKSTALDFTKEQEILEDIFRNDIKETAEFLDAHLNS